jgi:glycerol-3-phosphate dehydrogenase
MFDVVIVGAGITGGMIARELSKYQLKICILEKENDVAMGATKANSAIVHAGFDAKAGTLKAKLNVRGSEMMEQVAKELGVKYKKNGSLVVAFNEDDLETLKKLYEQGCNNGVKKLRLIDSEELHRLEPSLSANALGALVAPTGAIVCPYELNIASVGNAMDNGAELKRNFNVTAIEKTANGFVIRSEDDFVEAKFVVNAAGVYADEIAKLAGDNSFNIIPRRGEYILMDKECGNTVSHTIFRTPSKMGKGILVTPTVDGNLLLGPTAENIEDKDDTQTTAPGISSVLGNASEVLSKVPGGKNITSFCGLRAVGDTGDFIINSPFEGFINAAGIESPGLSSSPAIAEYVVDLLEKNGLALEKAPSFDPYREAAHAFREMSMEEKNKVIAKDPRYGRIVCRCETISEGEIVDAIHKNPAALDIDGVKRRTRSGMGRCQGGFCSPYVVELISKELEIPYEKVTKFGKGSYVNIGKTK